MLQCNKALAERGSTVPFYDVEMVWKAPVLSHSDSDARG
jgi:hypothetical protein